MPDSRSFMASGYNPANGKMYLVGGDVRETFTASSASPRQAPAPGRMVTPGAVMDTTWEYDPVGYTWAV